MENFTGIFHVGKWISEAYIFMYILECIIKDIFFLKF